MAKTGRKLDKRIGEWFGPCTAAYVLRFSFYFLLMVDNVKHFFKKKHTIKRRLSVRHIDCPISLFVNQDQIIYCDLLEEQALGSILFFFLFFPWV